MEQIDLSTLAGDMFNMLVPESVSSKVSSLRTKKPRKTASIGNLKNAPPPPQPSRRRSASTSVSTAVSTTSSGRTYAESDLLRSASGSAESLISEAESNATTLYSSSSTSSSTRTSVSGRSSLSSLDYSRHQYHQQQQQQLQQFQHMQQQHQQQQLQPFYPPPPQYQHYAHQQPQQQYGAPLAPVMEEQQQLKLKQLARDSKAEPHESRWTPSGVKWRYARQGTYTLYAPTSAHFFWS
ncbi:hypothetical protein PG996_009817 [Apiospora saccharicola]|uniref:WW domain-containing protein n=1 Tax=Apiospora saccharicola TaxID=335842 RepID=A0ABR1UMI3_9PEZI